MSLGAGSQKGREVQCILTQPTHRHKATLSAGLVSHAPAACRWENALTARTGQPRVLASLASDPKPGRHAMATFKCNSFSVSVHKNNDVIKAGGGSMSLFLIAKPV